MSTTAQVIYSPSDPHRTRTAGIVSVLAPWIQHLADDFGISLYFQVYELSSPPGVCSPVNATSPPALLNCSLSGPHLYPLLQVRSPRSSTPLLTLLTRDCPRTIL